MTELLKTDPNDTWARWIKRQSEIWETDEKTVIEWLEKVCANDPWADYDAKVLVIKLDDVTYGPGLSSYLKEKQLDYYVERLNCESPLVFHILGSFDAQAEAAKYIYNIYDDLDMDDSFYWTEGPAEERDGGPDDYTVHELTGCTLEEFCQKVQIFYEQNPLRHC